MLRFRFLGVNGSLQEEHNGNTSLLIFGEEGSVAVDLSCKIAAAIEADIDAVILTHEHIDHIYALPSLLHQLWLSGRKRALDLYIPGGMGRLVGGLVDLFGIREKKDIFEIRLCEDRMFQVGSVRVTTFRTGHTGISVGFVAEEGADKLAYTGDTRPLKEAPSIMDGAQVLIHEASGLLKDEETLLGNGHSSGADAAGLARELKVKKLYLCHLPRGEEAKQEILREARSVFWETYIADTSGVIPVGGKMGESD